MTDSIHLHNGVEMPVLGFGTYQIDPETAYNATSKALATGYRSIDTAAFYNNEKEVGNAIRDSGIPRKDIFLTTKLWNDNQGYQEAKDAFARSMEQLQSDYVDLYLIHWPVSGKYIDSWRALEELYQEQHVRAIGVSNFNARHIEDLLTRGMGLPAVNQIELHPYLSQKSLRNYCAEKQIRIESWAPIMKGHVTEDDKICALASRYEKTPAQVVIRWHIQHGLIPLPKSITPSRIEENFDVFDFQLSDEDMQIIDSLNYNHRYGPDPETFC